MRRNTRDDEEYRSYITASFDRWARLYDPFLALFRLKGVRRATVEMSGAQPGDRVLDVCTGTGDVALEFARRCDDVTGIDLSDGMLAVAQRCFPRRADGGWLSFHGCGILRLETPTTQLGLRLGGSDVPPPPARGPQAAYGGGGVESEATLGDTKWLKRSF